MHCSTRNYKQDTLNKILTQIDIFIALKRNAILSTALYAKNFLLFIIFAEKFYFYSIMYFQVFNNYVNYPGIRIISIIK